MLEKIITSLFIDTESKNDINFLKNVDFFKKFNIWQLKKILAIIYKKDYLKGEIIYNKGEEAKLFCILKMGQVELLNNENKKDIYPNNIFGERALMCDNELYSDTAKVSVKSRVYIIHKYDLEALMDDDTKIGFKIAKMLLYNLYNEVK